MDLAAMQRLGITLRGDCILREQVIDEVERRELLVWARRMRPHLMANRQARNFNRVESLPYLPPLYTLVRLRVQELLGLDADAVPEAKLGWYLSIIADDGFVHPHLDATLPDTRHLRCNLFLQLPHHGGRPIITNAAFDVSEGGLIAFFPSERPHSSEPIQGRRRRILLSFGYNARALPPSRGMSEPIESL